MHRLARTREPVSPSRLIFCCFDRKKRIGEKGPAREQLSAGPGMPRKAALSERYSSNQPAERLAGQGVTADAGSGAQGAPGLRRSPPRLLSRGLLPGREETAGEEAAVVPHAPSTDTQCRLRAHSCPRHQGSAVNRAQARGAASTGCRARGEF